MAIAGGEVVYGALMGVDQGDQLSQEQLADGPQLALTLKHSGEFCDVGLEPVLLPVALSGLTQVGDHSVDIVFQLGDFAARFNLNRTREISFRHGRGHFGDSAHLIGDIGGEKVDVAGKIFPCPRSARNVGLTTESSFHANFARNVRHLIGESGERVGHVVNGVGQSGNFALGLHSEPLGEISVGYRGHHLHDAANLLSKIGRHKVHIVRKVLPGAPDTGNLRLAAQLALGADLARDARNFGGKAVELIDHRVDRVLQLKDFALYIDSDLAAQITARNSGGDVGNVANLRGEIGPHSVDRVGEVLPRSRDAGYNCLHSEPPFSAHLARHACDLGCKRTKLLDHRIDGLLEL